MKNLKHKGRDVKVVKMQQDCDSCIFYKQCSAVFFKYDSRKWEAENALQPCYEKKVQYIYA